MKKPIHLIPAFMLATTLWAQTPKPTQTNTPEATAAPAAEMTQAQAAETSSSPAVEGPVTNEATVENQATDAPATAMTPESQTLAPEAATPISATASTDSSPEAALPQAETTETQDNTSATQASSTADKAGDQTKAKTPKSDKDNADSKGAGAGEGSGAGMSGGSISVGLTELDGESVTRISYRPEVTLGKFGVALDLELFIDSDGNFLPFGWEFDTKDQILTTLYRKIYYIRWDQPGAPFYARAGALEGITLDAAGLVTNNWGNVANYPKQKLIGIHTQINESFTPFAISIDVATNSVQDWHQGGGVLALKGGFAPIASLPIPILNGLRLSATSVTDFNQKAAIADRDEDKCPDDLDYDPKNSGICSDPNVNLADMRNLSSDELVELRDNEIGKLDERNNQIKSDFRSTEKFTIMAIDALLPIWNEEFSSLRFFSEAAKPITQDEVKTTEQKRVAQEKKEAGLDGLNESWALVPFGLDGHLSILEWGFQYRILNGGFSPGHFDAAYELQRMNFVDGEYRSKKDMYWEENLGFRKGYYGTLGANLFDIVRADASYAHLVSEKKEQGKTIPDDRSFSAQAGLGSMILEYVPKVSKAQVFLAKTKIGQDFWKGVQKNSAGTLVPVMRSDSFFQIHEFTTWGFTIGSELGGGLELHITRSTTFEREYKDGNRTSKLIPNDNFFAETVLKF